MGGQQSQNSNSKDQREGRKEDLGAGGGGGEVDAPPEVTGDAALPLPVRALPQHVRDRVECYGQRHLLAQRVQHVPGVQLRSCGPPAPFDPIGWAGTPFLLW